MAGLAGPVLGLGLSRSSASSFIIGDGAARSAASRQTPFARRFAAESAEAGLERTLAEERKRAESLFAEERWDEAMQSFEAMAHAAVEQQDKSSEAVAVLRIADCLSKPEKIDAELICGMYRYAGDAAQEVGDASTRFSALVGCAQVRQSCGMFERSEALWQAALDLAIASGISQHVTFARSKLAMILLQDPTESNLDIVDESKDHAGHASMSQDDGIVQIHGGVSARVEKALRLLQEVVAELSQTASPTEHAIARMNLVAALKRQKGVLSKRKIEQEMVLALDLVTSVGGHPGLQKSIEAALLEHYEDNAWLADGNKSVEQRFARLQAKQVAQVKTIEQLVADKGKPLDPDERYAHERALWAAQKLEAIKNARDGDSDSDDAAPACPPGQGWQR